jgi:hypothetical protein
VIALLGVTSAAARAEEEKGGGRKILEFSTMYGVDGPFVNNNQIRGILGDELPWEIGHVSGSLGKDGRLNIEVKGLVFANDPSVPINLRGINDEDTFRALVSCLSEGAGDQITTVNITTGGFKATKTGDSHIQTRVELPKSCVAPVIFILSGSEDKWFSVTGAETGE